LLSISYRNKVALEKENLSPKEVGGNSSHIGAELRVLLLRRLSGQYARGRTDLGKWSQQKVQSCNIEVREGIQP
jgi:hypothetical protein